jgi:hypothetical protein
MEPQPGYLFGQSAHQSTDNNNKAIQVGTYGVNNSDEADTYEFAEGGFY